MGFAEDLAAQCERILQEVNQKCYGVWARVSTRIVQRSPSPSNPGPYAKGVLANQWYPMEGENFSSQLTEAKSPTGSDSIARINAMSSTKEFYGKDGAMTLSNNVDYSYRAEYLGWPVSDGWSGRFGPYRMVALSIAEVVAENQ